MFNLKEIIVVAAWLSIPVSISASSSFRRSIFTRFRFSCLPRSSSSVVVSLAPSNTEILFAIGAGSQVVGRDTLSDYPEAAKAVTDIGSAFEALNTELILSLEADLVLTAEKRDPWEKR